MQNIIITKMSEVANNNRNGRIIEMLRNPKMNTYTSDYIVEIVSRQSLLKLQQFMRKNKSLKVTGFLRFFRELLPFDKTQTSKQTEFFLHYALFKLFTQICNSKKKTEVSFSDISSFIAEKMPNFTQQSVIQQKLLPLGLNIDESHKKNIAPPEIYGQINEDRCFLTKRPIRSDRIQHMSRQVGQSEYSKKFKLYFSIDKPSTIISVYDDNFNQVLKLQTEQDMTKRDMVVNYIAWSDWEQKIACILGNYSISMWSKDDNYKYEVNVPLPAQYLANPYTIIKYMDSMRKWITLDNRPAFYVLNNNNYEPEYMFLNSKIRKKKESQKFYLTQLHYVQLLCIGFERNLFLISLKNKEIVSQLHNFRTSLTSIAFSQSYQALFVSTYENYFRSYQLSQFQDLMQRAKFEGHKSQISLLGVIQQKPIVFSLQQNSLLKMFDMRNSTCYQSVSVLKNILYKQVLYLEEAICLVGSKMHVYGIQRQLAYKEKQVIIHLGTLHKDLLIVTNKNIRIYDVRNGALRSVIKAVFEHSETSNDIFSVFNLATKQKIFIQNQQGQCQILETKQMSQIQTWKLPPKPSHMFFDQQNDLLTQVSLGNIYINQYNNEFCAKQLRRQVTNQNDVVRLIKVSTKHDLMVVCYEGDQCLYFYAYEKSKILGFLYFQNKRVVKFKNAYKQHKVIHTVVDVMFYQNKNVVFLLLAGQLQILTYKRSVSSMSFMLKKSIKLWQNPLKLTNGKTHLYDEADVEIPLHSTGLAIFQNTLTITSNSLNILCCINYDINQLNGVETYVINKDNYNPSRIGNQVHTGMADLKHPMVTIKDYISAEFTLSNYVYKSNLGNYVISAKIGNLLAVGDYNLNVALWQSPNWNQIAGVINCQQTLPKLWNIFRYSEEQMKEVEFVLDFIENQDKLPIGLIVKNLMETSLKAKQPRDSQNTKITISQLIKQDKLNGGLKTYRSCSLREKKIIMQKQRDEKQKLQNYLQQQKIDLKQKPSNSLKNNAQKQINDTLGYLSLNHNQTILKKGIIEQDMPEVRAFEKKLMASINKSDKKSLVSYKTGDQSFKSQSKLIPIVSAFAMNDLQLSKTLSTEIYEGLTQKLGLKSYTSKQLISQLNIQRNQSQRKMKMKSLSKESTERLPKIEKN